jgi:hypothetical protein
VNRSIPIPGEKPPSPERDPFPEPRCFMCGEVVRLATTNSAVLVQAVHSGLVGTLEQFLVERKDPGLVFHYHPVCHRPRSMERPR